VAVCAEQLAGAILQHCCCNTPYILHAYARTQPTQNATLYREGGRILPKEFSFKLQHVRGSGAEATKKTLGKLKVDMAAFCSNDTAATVPQELFLLLKCVGGQGVGRGPGRQQQYVRTSVC
jgi:hypothetical protein